MVAWIDRLNTSVNSSPVGRFFQMEARGTTLTTELKGAMATFLSMAYIVAVNPRILADSGGPCIPDPPELGGIFGPNYEACLENIKREYITATAIACMFGSFAMGLAANLPVALAPGMGMNAYFTYTVVGFRGTGKVAYQSAVTAVLIEGAIFLVLAVTGIRYALVKLIPEPVRIATPAAIGAFLAHLGLQTSEGLGIVVGNTATLVTVGGCPLSQRSPIVALTESCSLDTGTCVVSDGYVCDDGIMTSGTTWMGILGLVIIGIFMSYKKNSAFLIGIGFVTVVSWFRNTAVTYFPNTPAGDARFDYFKQVVAIEPVDDIVGRYTNNLNDAGVALFTFLYVDFLDTSGTLLGLCSAMGFVDSDGNFPRAREAFSVDAIATMFGSIFGLSPVTSYIESGAGVAAGSRTGLTACFVGFFFFLTIFFAPIIASIPPWATGGALITVGAIMASSLAQIKWHDPLHASTAFLVVMIMPLTYSISYGLLAGIANYLILSTVFFLLEMVGIRRPSYEATPMIPPANVDDVNKKELADSEEEENGPPADYDAKQVEEGAKVEEGAMVEEEARH